MGARSSRRAGRRAPSTGREKAPRTRGVAARWLDTISGGRVQCAWKGEPRPTLPPLSLGRTRLSFPFPPKRHCVRCRRMSFPDRPVGHDCGFSPYITGSRRTKIRVPDEINIARYRSTEKSTPTDKTPVFATGVRASLIHCVCVGGGVPCLGRSVPRGEGYGSWGSSIGGGPTMGGG